MFDAVAVTYIIMVLLILLGAWLHCKDLTASSTVIDEEDVITNTEIDKTSNDLDDLLGRLK